jgi:hypothetical protein
MESVQSDPAHGIFSEVLSEKRCCRLPAVHRFVMETGVQRIQQHARTMSYIYLPSQYYPRASCALASCSASMRADCRSRYRPTLMQGMAPKLNVICAINPIASDKIEYDVTDPRGGRRLHFHFACHSAAQRECARRLAANTE